MAALFVFNNFRAFDLTLALLSSLFTFFLFPMLHSAQPEFTSALKRAERLFCEKLYGDALPLYSELSQTASEIELKSQLKLRLAACLLEEGQPQKALAELSSLKTSLYRNQTFYLLSQAHRRIGTSQEALHSLVSNAPRLILHPMLPFFYWIGQAYYGFWAISQARGLHSNPSLVI